MEHLEIISPLKGYYPYVVAMSIAGARMGGMMLVMPAMTRLGLTGVIRMIVALVLSLPLLPIMVALVETQSLAFGQVVGILVKEAAVGIVIGLLLGVPLWAAEAAGEILDLQRGVSFAELVDPSYVNTNNIMGTLFSLVMVAVYFLGGGLSVTLRAVYDSYTLWPVASFMPIFSAEAGELLLRVLDDIAGLGVMLVAPLILAMLLADLALALVARAAPHMNVFVLSLPVKNFALALLLVLYGAFFMSYLGEAMGWLNDGRAKLERMAPARP